MKRFGPIIMAFLGFGLVVSAVLPAGKYLLRDFLKPVPKLADPKTDYLITSNWFSGQVKLPEIKKTSVEFFTLNYPGLEMTDVAVKINSENLKQSASHFPGTPLPGEYGNTVIFGHSALPQLYKPGNPLTIFNPLLKAKIGDEVSIIFDGIVFRYQVNKITEVNPDKIEVLAQNFSRKELTLITCTPLGTYWKRWVVRAELVN